MSDEQEVTELTLNLLSEPESRPFGDGLVWINEAVSLIKQRFGMWLVIGLVNLLIYAGLSVILGLVQEANVWLAIPFNFIVNAVFVMLCAGLVVAAASLAEEDDLEISYLFTGIQYKFKEILILYLLSIIGIVLIAAILAVIAMFGGGFMWAMNNMKLLVSIFVLFYMVLLMCGWFSLPLVMLHDISPLQAMKMSFAGCLKNIAPAICYFLVLILVGFGMGFLGATMTAIVGKDSIVGMLILMPFLIIFTMIVPVFSMITIYTSYRNIWTNLPMR